jgi:hypothetical protein
LIFLVAGQVDMNFPADHKKLLDEVVGLGQDGTQQSTQAPHYSQDQSETTH